MMMRSLLASVVLLCAFSVQATIAARILVIIMLPSKSHTILGNAIVNNLLEAGHEVTYITPILINNPPANLHQIDISSNIQLLPKDVTNLKSLIEGNAVKLSINEMTFVCHHLNKAGVMHENVQEFLKDSEQKFDVVIAEYTFNTIQAGFSEIFKCPLIWFTPIESTGDALRLMDEMTNPAYVPALLSKHLPPLTFYQRVLQLIQVLYATVLNKLLTYTLDQWAYKEAFGSAADIRGVELSHLSQAELSASLMLSNSHISMANPISLPQNCKTIGGYHIDNNTKPLPQDIKNLMDGAKNGVIYFSMGTNINGKELPEKTKRKLLDIFGTLNQTVIWKFEEILPDLPKNVHILKWAPQQSILAHPNCILFISHGGLLSTTETIHFGVPIIGIPGFGDQFANVHNAVAKGFAIEVMLNYDLPFNLKVAINEVLSNSSYREAAERLSSIYHDRPMPPAKELVYWVEHVIRTKGAPHLRSMALMTPWYQKLYLDLIALIGVILYVFCKLKDLVFPSKKDKLKKN